MDSLLTPRRPEWIDDPGRALGMATADYDQDGQIDFISTEWNRGFTLYRNSGAAGADNHWLTLRRIRDGPVQPRCHRDQGDAHDNEGNIFLQELTSGISLGRARAASGRSIWPGHGDLG